MPETEHAKPPAPRALRLTRPGWGALLAAFVTVQAALVSGNNLLYLLFAVALAAFLLSWLLGRLNLRGVGASLAAPAQVFRGAEFTLTVSLLNRSALPALGLRVAARGQRPAVERLEPGGERAAELRYLLPHRGLNRPADLRLESSYPFGLLLHSRPLEAGELAALPRTRDVRAAADLGRGVEVRVSPAARRGRSGDLWGVREMRPDEDIRAVNWKLSAKAGRLMAVEYAEAAGARATVRLQGPVSGPAGDARAEEAAGACRFFIDAGAEVKLVTPEGEVDYGRGLLHLDRLLNALALAGDGAAPRPAAAPDAAPAEAPPDDRLWAGLTLAGCWLVYFSMFLVEEFRAYPSLAVAALLAAASAWRARRLPALPARLWDAATLAVLAHAVLFHWRQAGIMVANTWLVSYMLVYFAFNAADRAGYRRAFTVFYLGFFLVSGQTISLWYFPVWLAYLAFCTAWLAAEWGAGLRGRGWPRLLAPAGLALALLGAAVFAVIPRVDPLVRRSPIAASLGLDKLTPRSSAVGGFTTNVTLGYFGELRRSSARVMRVRPLASVGSAPPPLYLRGTAFDAFDGLRWSRTPLRVRYRLDGRPFLSRDGGVPMAAAGAGLRLPGSAPAAPALSAEYTLYPVNLSVIFTAYPLGSVEGPPSGAFFDHTDSAYFAAPYTAGARYVARGLRGAAYQGALALAYEPERLLALYLRTPPGEDPRVRALALRVTRGAAGDLAKARAVERYLRSAYGYSLFSGGEGSGLEDFLFRTKEGNCEYFASAAAVLLRHAGVPARLVSGFLADSFNEYGNFYDVRQSQAHAWTEAYVRGQGWVRVDATPSGSAASAWGRRFAGRLSRWVEAGNVNWYRHVIGYDTYAQRNTFHRLGLAVSRWNLARALGWLAAAAALAFLLRAAWRARPRRARRQAALDLFSRAQALLEDAGLPREPWQTPREYAAFVSARRPDLAAVARLAEEHYLERYAGRPRGEADLAEARRLLAELRGRAGGGPLARLRRGFR